MCKDEGPRVSDEILTERHGRVLVITINRLEARNAVNLAVSHGLADATDELDEDADLSAAVITGAGGNFCAGMDLKAFAGGEVVAIPGRGIGFTERPPRKPLISAVEGYALAGGTEVVLSTDLVGASRAAKFGIPEVKRGLVAAGGGLLRLLPGRRRGAGCTRRPDEGGPGAGGVDGGSDFHLGSELWQLPRKLALGRALRCGESATASTHRSAVSTATTSTGTPTERWCATASATCITRCSGAPAASLSSGR
jgi:hypothetical protein